MTRKELVRQRARARAAAHLAARRALVAAQKSAVDAAKAYLAEVGRLRVAATKLAVARGDVGAELALSTSEAESELLDRLESAFADDFDFLQRDVFE